MKKVYRMSVVIKADLVVPVDCYEGTKIKSAKQAAAFEARMLKSGPASENDLLVACTNIKTRISVK